jgi:zinc D-Ala-D-Ala carboxypeptidase
MAPVARPPFQEMLTEHFSLSEMTRTSKPFPNVPRPLHIARMRRLCRQLLEPWRMHIGPIYISSGFRSLAVNRAVGGEDDSQHMLGEASDAAPLRRPLDQAWQTLARLVEEGLPLDQGILYVRPEGEGWVHVSYTERRSPRRELLVNPAPGSREYPAWKGYRGPLVLPAG